jgi:predicted Zn-dependent peptidase
MTGMKRLKIFLLCAGGAAAALVGMDRPPAFAPPVSENTVVKSLTLENGLRVILLERHNLPLVNVVAAVDAGSKDETDASSGITHILEHYVLFRGTEMRSGSQVAKEIRRHGAYFNAQTGQDLSVFEISLPAEHADFALANQKDILFHLKLTPAELDAEKEVVLEEIRLIEDDPFRFGTSLVFQNLFPGHPYQRPIYGRAEAIKALTVDDVDRFYRARFVPSAMALAVVGDFMIADMEAKIRAAFGPVPRVDPIPVPLPKPVPLAKTVEIELERDVGEGYLIIGAAGPDYSDPDQYASDVLAQALGQGLNPMLNIALRGGRRDLIHTVQMSYTALKRAGAFIVYLTLDPKNLGAARKEAVSFLRQVRGASFSKEEFFGEERRYAYEHLESARNELRLDVQQTWESGLGLAYSLAMHVLINETSGGIDYLERIARVKPPDLRKIGSKYLSHSEFVIVTVRPKKK